MADAATHTVTVGSVTRVLPVREARREMSRALCAGGGRRRPLLACGFSPPGSVEAGAFVKFGQDAVDMRLHRHAIAEPLMGPRRVSGVKPWRSASEEGCAHSAVCKF